jgi:hypothetical protein
MTSKTKFDYHRLIVNCFCDFEKGTYGAKLNEAVKIYDKYPDPEFWDWMIINCSFKLPTLDFFLTEDGTRFIQEKYKLMRTKESKKPFTNIGLGAKVGKDKRYPKKNLTVLDFIRNGKKKED